MCVSGWWWCFSADGLHFRIPGEVVGPFTVAPQMPDKRLSKSHLRKYLTTTFCLQGSGHDGDREGRGPITSFYRLSINLFVITLASYF